MDDTLQRILETGDEDACADFFRGMPERERRGLAPLCREWPAALSQRPRDEHRALAGAARIARVCTASLTELRRIPWYERPSTDRFFELLSDRRPEWLEKWALGLLENERYWIGWRLVRRLVRAGLVPKPDHPHYTLGIIDGVVGWPKPDAPIEACLLADPELLEADIWKLFEVEGDGNCSLAMRDGNRKPWQGALIALMDQGHLARERLHRCSLEAMERGFTSYHAKWFTAFYDATSPTPEEERAHAGAYLRLCGVGTDSVVSWAFGRAAAQARRRAYAPAALVRGVALVLLARGKGLVKRALKLIVRTAKDAPGVRIEAAVIAAQALHHDAVDVQAAALTAIEALAPGDDPALAAALAPYVGTVAPSLRGRIARWTGGGPRVSENIDETEADPEALTPALRRLYAVDDLLAQPVGERFAVPGARFDGTELPQLAHREPVTPILDLHELIDLTARVLEDAAGPDDVERVMDGLSRLCDQRPDDFEQRTAPLLKRARQLLSKGRGPFLAEGPGEDMGGLVIAWLSGGVATLGTETTSHGTRMDTVELDGKTLSQWSAAVATTLGVLSRRSFELSHRLASRTPRPLLSAPTHAGGFIDPVVLAERVNRWGEDEPIRSDVVLAMLRLAPERRPEALAALTERPEEWARAIRHALGGDVEIGPSAGLWIAAARARAPYSRDEKVLAAFPDAGPNAGEPAVYDFEIVKDRSTHRLSFPKLQEVRESDPDCVPLRLQEERGHYLWERGGVGGRTALAVGWTATAWPLARESFFCAAAVQLGNNIDWWEAEWQNKALLLPLLDPGVPLREMGLLLLAFGLGAKDPGEAGLATDVAIAAVEDGRLGSDTLGPLLARLLHTSFCKPARYARTLGDVAQVSAAHAAVVKLTLEPFTAAAPPKPPRDIWALLELLRELSVELAYGVALPDHREALGRFKGSGKAARLARVVLEIPVDPASAPMRVAMQQAVGQRVTAAGRWSE